MDTITLIIGGSIGFTVGIIVAALLLAWGEKRNIRRLEDMLGARWKMRIESIQDLLRKKALISFLETIFVLLRTRVHLCLAPPIYNISETLYK